MKKLVDLLLVFMLVLTSGCGKTGSGVNKEYYEIIKNAAEKLNNTYTDYVVATTIESFGETTEFINVVHGDVDYTEFSVDDEDNIGTIQYGSEDTISYILTDWFDKDNKFYMFLANEEGVDIPNKLPSSYNKYVNGRKYLYVLDFLEHAISIEPYQDINLNLGQGEETFKCYNIKVKAQLVKDILGSSSYGVYKSLKDDKDTSKNVSDLCDYYLEDLDMALTFSDANVIVGIDNNGILKYICLETGGLGTRMYYTKAVVAIQNPNIRETPDFSKSVDYANTMKEMADYLAGFDSYDDAFATLESQYQQYQEDTETIENEKGESNEEE